MPYGFTFVWDPNKAAENLRKHGISFEDAKTLFADTNEVMLSDPDHSEEEERFVSIGKASDGRVMLASYTEEDSVIRLISVREATKLEAAFYLRGGDNAR